MITHRAAGLLALLATLLFGIPTTSADQPELFRAVMIGVNVAPEPVSTQASARGTAVLTGRVLTVHGSFHGLSGNLRDLIETPEDPGIHIHPGASGETAPYLYGLAAELAPDGRSGIFHGRFELTAGEVRKLREGRIYLDIHTSRHEDGEVRGQLLPLAGHSQGTVNEGLGRVLED